MKRTALLTSIAAIGYASAPPAAVEPKKPSKPKATTDDAVTVTGIATIDMPTPSTRRGGTESKYSFDKLEVGQAFGVIGKDKRGMAGAVSNANRKNTSELTNPETNEVTKVAGKHFFAIDVDAERAKTLKGTPLEGSTVLVFRDK